MEVIWVALCLENGLVGQGDTKEGAIEAKEPISESFELKAVYA